MQDFDAAELEQLRESGAAGASPLARPAGSGRAATEQTSAFDMAIYDASYEKYKRRLQMPPSDESRVNTERDVRADDSTSKRARESFEQFRLRNVSSAHIFRFPMVEGAFGRANVRPRARYRPKWEAFTDWRTGRTAFHDPKTCETSWLPFCMALEKPLDAEELEDTPNCLDERGAVDGATGDLLEAQELAYYAAMHDEECDVAGAHARELAYLAAMHDAELAYPVELAAAHEENVADQEHIESEWWEARARFEDNDMASLVATHREECDLGAAHEEGVAEQEHIEECAVAEQYEAHMRLVACARERDMENCYRDMALQSYHRQSGGDFHNITT